MQFGFYTDSIIKFPPYENYTCNQHGYRTHEFNDWTNFCLVLGESNVFGIGVEDSKVFANILDQQVEEKIYNLGQPGASCEECVRILYSFGEIPPPKKVIMVWPYFLRRNYQSCDAVAPVRITGSKEIEYVKHIQHNTEKNDVASFLQQVFFVEHWCKWRQVECQHFLISEEDRKNLEKFGKVIERLYLHSFQNHAQDLGDDGGHFGRASHHAFAQYIKNSVF